MAHALLQLYNANATKTENNRSASAMTAVMETHNVLAKFVAFK